ncbi:complex I NDUFA9 subunit family protein [Ideonella azotifigens]|uniref:Complex I NDUFA9 subunit family protein n=1 Tax=Ideonella azotifigens TaxID=513160 RepID=A0ABP3VH49_9BURK|nr:complex I NDUFA9 subunit family protein [Ideonella azotifigens]MCD2339060.1 complex I NDUFA9 subunit family protein [Ideonella azotifigens]
MNQVLILGGSGFVGRTLCELLVRGDDFADGRFHEALGNALGRRDTALRLVVPTRRRVNARNILPLPLVDLLEADVHDDKALDGLLQGCDAVVNLIAKLQGSEAELDAVNAKLPARLAAACQRTGVKRVVHVSALGAASDAPSRYLRSKAKGEAALQGKGLTVTVLRPSVIFGDGDHITPLFASLQRRFPVLPLAGAHAKMQPVWVGDVAAAITKVLSWPATQATPTVIECAGPEVVTLGELAQQAGWAAGQARPVWALPGPLATLQAMLMELAPGEPLLSRDNLASLTVPNVASANTPGLASLGIVPQPMSAILPATLGAGQRCARLDGFRARHR